MGKARMLSIGLTGGIGSGKSRVADLLAQWGAALIDTDVIAHALTGPQGEAMPALREAFGVQAVTAEGALNRAWMRERVFRDPDAKARLEGILHPLISRHAREQGERARGAYRVYVVPLLVESGRWRDKVDRICVVDCDPETQISRVRERSGLTPDGIRAIMAAQSTREARLQVADDVILNDGATSAALLHERTRMMHDRWIALAAALGTTRGRQASA
ncbi:MAG TPA: dephospho-CoA kinase [Bordetella sp.]